VRVRQRNMEVAAEAEADVEEIRRIIVQGRKDRGLVQMDVSEQVGVSQSTISFLEQGKVRLTVDLAAQLLRLYGYKLVVIPDDGS
jgi:ribosome-binding protein aMBF1 (putative translation factor)